MKQLTYKAISTKTKKNYRKKNEQLNEIHSIIVIIDRLMSQTNSSQKKKHKSPINILKRIQHS